MPGLTDQDGDMLALQHDLRKANAEVEQLRAENKTLRNELCLRCGQHHNAHLGACDGCRWKGEKE